MAKNIIDVVRLHLDRSNDLMRVSVESGVPHGTIVKIANRTTENPRVNTVQSLYDYFTKARKK